LTKIVVAGASGFIGSKIFHELEAGGREVIGVSRTVQRRFVRVISYADVPEGDVLIFAAEPNHVEEELEGSDADLETRLRVLELLTARPWRRIIYLSSAAVYGDRRDGSILATVPPHPISAYAIGKVKAEEVVLRNPRSVILRLSNVYGPGMSSETVVSTILKQINSSDTVQVVSLTPVRDFIWVTDVVKLVTKIIDMPGEGSFQSQIFNVGTGIGTSVASLVHLALELAGKPHQRIICAERNQLSSSIVLHVKETEQCWNWKSSTSIREGLRLLLLDPSVK
jgi:nucleoside-diphosphate-sugar epimerase